MKPAFLPPCGKCLHHTLATPPLLSRLHRGRYITRAHRAAPVLCQSDDALDEVELPATDSDSRIRTEFREDIPLLNSVVLTGRLGQDPKLRTVGRNNTELCTFSLAVQDDVYDMNEERTTSWFNIQMWGSLATRAASALRKGLRVGVTGRLGIDEWTGRDGEQRSTVTITANTFEILQSRSEIGFDGPRDFGSTTNARTSSSNVSTSQSGSAMRNNTTSVQSGSTNSISNFDEEDPF